MTLIEDPGTAVDERTAERPRPRRPTRRHGGWRARCGCASATARSNRSTSTRSSAPSPALPEGLDGVDPMRVATRTISGLPTGPPRWSSTTCRSAPPPRSSSRSRTTAKLAARLLATVIDKEVTQPGHPLVLPVDRRRPPRRARRRRHRRLRQPTPASSTRRSRPTATGCSSSSACAPSTTATCCATPKRRVVIETPQYFFLRVACGLATTRRGGDRALRPDLVARLPAVEPTLFNSGTTHPQMSSCYLLDSPGGQPRGHLRALHGRRPAVEVRRRHRPRLPPRARRGLADPRHQRPVQRHRPVAEDPRLVGRRGQPGRQAQGRRVRLPRDVARRHRGLPRAARQHRRRGPPHAQPQPRQLGPRPVHGARREGLDSGRCSTRRWCRTSPTCTAPSSSGPTSRPSSRACTSARSRPASSTRG